MRAFVLTFIAIFMAALAATWYVLSLHDAAPGTSWVELYFSQARIPMFSGFLTVGSFLLTLQTAIIQRLKDAYDTEKYRDAFLVLHAKDKKVRYYGSLERMSVALSGNVILALTTATVQLSVGFIRTPFSTAVCLAFAITSIALVVYLTIQLLLAHRAWFDRIEADKRRELAKFVS
jgi:hypothetical protein